MSPAAPVYREKTASKADIHHHLCATSDDFLPPLELRVDLLDYSGKLFERAQTFEAWSGGALVGLVAAYLDNVNGRAGYITSVSVTREFTGHGVADTLMRMCLRQASSRGLEVVTLEVNRENTTAISIYRRLGFQERSNNEDSMTMQLSFANDPTGDSSVRDFNKEYRDVSERQYAYDFDWIVRKYLLKAVSPFFTEGRRAVELGCYKGDMTEQILEYFERLTVVEASSELCDVVSNRFPGKLEVINARFEDVRLEREFDVIFLVHTLEHLDDPIGLLSKIKEWMVPGGRLVVAVPNANALSRQIAVRMGLVAHNTAITSAERDHGHRITYSSDIFEHHLHSAGLSIVHGGGILLKALANFQFDKALKAGIVDDKYLDGCFELGKLYPDFCASLFAVCESR